MKPRVFIGSSSEGLPVAEYIAELLGPDTECYLWTNGIFRFNDSPFHTLLHQAGMFDFGILVATKDDFTLTRKEIFESPRDNVIFEFGLFLGRLGGARAFLLHEEDGKLPSDLLGITVAKFDLFGRPEESDRLKDAVEHIRKIINERISQGMLNMLPSTAIAISYFHNFVKLVVNAMRASAVSPGINGIPAESRLVVVIPATLDSDVKEQADEFYRKRNLKEISIESSGRNYPVYVTAGEDISSRYCIYDMPTALLGIDKAIELYTGRGTIGKSPDQQLLEERELRNFRHVLKLLIEADTYSRRYVDVIIDSEGR